MKLKGKYKKNSDSHSLIEIFSFCFLFLFSATQPVFAEPSKAGIPLPPASFSYVDDLETLELLGLEGYGGAWCYDDHANAILITAAARERAQCELSSKFEIEKQKIKYEFEIEKLKIRVDTLITQHQEINRVKDEEIERLTTAALKRPNDYSVWWASGGFAAGILVTVGVFLAL